MRASSNTGEFTVLEVFMYAYCPREFYFYRKLGVPPLPLKKMSFAKEQHEREEVRAGRRRVVYGIPKEEISEIAHDLPLEDRELGLYGKVDTVLKLVSGEFVPVEVKYSNFTHVSRAWRKQMVAYAVLLERFLKKRISRGLIYLLPSKRSLWVKILHEDKVELKKDLERMREIISSDSLPKVVDSAKCGYCEFRRYCKRI